MSLSTPIDEILKLKHDPRIVAYSQALSNKKPLEGYTPEYNYSYTGEIDGSEVRATPIECARMCDLRPDCIGFNYNAEWKSCTLSKSRVERIYAPGSVYFRKIGTLDRNPLVHPNLGYLAHNPSGIAFT